ncbi:MAG: LysM peptidoglycan-binding domain-containing protein, partial [Bacteroidota bacterium]|nr:LysM peptidoglycan-binding domain-containing protein [Bacteroidota bacterium]
NRHNITVEQLRTWNNLNANSKLLARQKLTIYVSAAQNNLLASNSTDQTEVSETTEVKTPVKSISTRSKNSNKKSINRVKLVHTVQPNDTLWSISRRYNDIPVEKIKKLNRLKTNSLKPGMKLVVS